MTPDRDALLVPCSDCGAGFYPGADMHLHRKKFHPPLVTVGGKPGWVCGVCGVTVTQAHFKRHLWKHDRDTAKATVDAAWWAFVERDS